MADNEQGFRMSVELQVIISAALIEREGKFLITRRVAPYNKQWHHRWEVPGGKIHFGETPLEALKREVYEETGLRTERESLLSVHTHLWDKLQVFILLHFAHAPTGEVILNPRENDDFLWDTFENILKREDLLGGNIKMLLALKTHDLLKSH